MTNSGSKLIDGLRDAIAGNFTRVNIEGQVWVRHDAESPEGQLASARNTIADLTTEVDVLKSRIAELEAELKNSSPSNTGDRE
jgi:hypothetical protein